VNRVETYVGYFMSLIDGEFCLKMGALHRPESHVYSVVTLDRSKITGS